VDTSPDMIPRILHQTFPTSVLPEVLAQGVARLKAMNAGWDYRFYDDGEALAFIERKFGKRVLAAYHSINPVYGAARADLFRYLVMYKHGGVYLDIKSSVSRPLDETLRPDDSYLLAHWPNRPGDPYPGFGRHPDLHAFPRGEFQQWHIIAEPGHPFLRAVISAVLRNIDQYDPQLHGVGKVGVLRVTGPIAYSRVIASMLRQARWRSVDTHPELGLVYSVLDSPGQTRGGHKQLFAGHYTQLSEPVVLRP
jgi:mannosyltransferase OCH1-like enzyme